MRYARARLPARLPADSTWHADSARAWASKYNDPVPVPINNMKLPVHLVFVAIACLGGLELSFGQPPIPARPLGEYWSNTLDKGRGIVWCCLVPCPDICGPLPICRGSIFPLRACATATLNYNSSLERPFALAIFGAQPLLLLCCNIICKCPLLSLRRIGFEDHSTCKTRHMYPIHMKLTMCID